MQEKSEAKEYNGGRKGNLGVLIAFGVTVFSILFVVILLVQRVHTGQPGQREFIFFLLSLGAVFVFLVGAFILSFLEARRSHSLLIQKEEEILSMVDHLSDGIIEHDETDRIILMNSVAKILLGVGEKGQDPFGNLLAVFRAEYRPMRTSTLFSSSFAAIEELKSVKTAGELAYAEVRVENPIDRSLIVLSIPFVVNIKGKREKRFIKIIRDVSRELFLNRVKSEFIAIAAHQLRTPLSALKWAIALFVEAGKDFTEEQQDLLEKMNASNERMIRLVNDLLNVSRIEEGKFHYAFQKSDFVKLLETSVRELQPFIEQKNLSYHFQKPPYPQELYFDLEKMKMALDNVLQNAVNYTRPGGNIRVTIQKEYPYLVCTIQDTGVGIPKSQLPRIFEKFSRGENVIRMQTEGSGLGLFLARNIIVAHGGKISVDSEENKGTTVRIKLPLAKKAVQAKETAIEKFFDTV